MTNEELKKKIVDVLIKVDEYVRNEIIKATEEHRAFLTEDNQYYYIVADALIAAGIGDVSELKNHRVVAEYSLIPEDGNAYVLPNTPIRVKQLYSGEEVEQIVKERSEYKRRAERAEKALRDALEVLIGERGPVEENVKIALEQAEKELAEERKDD